MWFFCAILLELAGILLNVEVAETSEARRTGLMGRHDLEENSGMLFVWDSPQRLTFWMKNTSIPLSIGFFDEEQRFINSEEMAPGGAKNLPLYHSKKPAKYALELPGQWFVEHPIKPGTKFLFMRS